MIKVATDIRAEVIGALLGKPCWYASCGGAAGPTFELVFGAKIPREHKVKNEKHSEEFRQFEGESNLFVWCTWRLDNGNGPISSSDDSNERIVDSLSRLVGAVVRDIRIDMPGWDLHVSFSNGLTLRVFCDHVVGDPSFDGNWELCQQDKIILIGASSVCEVEPRDWH